MPFCELRLPIDSKTPLETISKLIISCFDLGYDRIVFCQTEHLKTTASKKNKNKKRKLDNNDDDDAGGGGGGGSAESTGGWICPKLIKIQLPDLVLQRCKQTKREFKILSRLNVIVYDNQSLHFLKRNDVQQFDLLSLQPINRDILLYLLNSPTIQFEILSLDTTDPNLLPFPSRVIRATADKGVTYELCYSGALKDPFERRYFMAFGRHLSNILHGKSLIFSSNATNPIQLRSPHDMMEIGQLFGLSDEKSRCIINENPIDVLTRSFNRRKTANGLIWMEPVQASTLSLTTESFTSSTLLLSSTSNTIV